ncbi:MAG: hypothetical protein ACE5G8_02850 [Anaerolineae bacterium]
MTTVLQTPHRIYKRYQSLVESAITAVGLGLLVAGALASMPVYPPNWAPVLVAGVIILALRWTAAAYILAALVVVYPVYTISLYLAILFVALAVLAHRPLSHYLGATVLILAVPLLAKYHLHWTVPILAGLWWGTVNGFWIAGAAALWGKLLGGMAGLNIDWLAMAGQSPAVAGLMQRFHGLDALETLLKILQPFAADATVLLYHLLQIVLWAVAGALVGFLARQKWIQHRYPWSILVTTAAGAAALVAGHILLFGWLTEAAPAAPNYNYLIVGAVAAMLVGGSLEATRKFLDFPLVLRAKKKKPVAPAASPTATSQPPQRQVATPKRAPVPLPELPEWKPPDEDNDLILLELD